jgi:hypothetical protein
MLEIFHFLLLNTIARYKMILINYIKIAVYKVLGINKNVCACGRADVRARARARTRGM